MPQASKRQAKPQALAPQAFTLPPTAMDFPFDPVSFGVAAMNWWRLTMFDIPMAYAAEMGACMDRLARHQAEFLQNLSASASIEDLARAQTRFFDESVEDYESSAAAISRDLAITLDSAKVA